LAVFANLLAHSGLIGGRQAIKARSPHSRGARTISGRRGAMSSWLERAWKFDHRVLIV
jgi:hypothetical protein